MKRRRALKNIGIGASAGLTLSMLPGWLSSCAPDDPAPEVEYNGIVAIIGAGAAGLHAADILRTKGVQVKVFEASDRVGGRIRSLRLFDESLIKTDFPIELGAERIIGTDSSWANMINQLQIPFVDLSSIATDNFILDNTFKEGSSVLTDADFSMAKNFLDDLRAYSGGDISVQQAIGEAGISSRLHAILNGWIGNKYGTDNSRIGIRALAESLNQLVGNRNEWTLRSNIMQDVLSSRFSAVVPAVELNTVIRSIDYSSSKILLTGERTVSGGATENISEEVDKVIVAVPVTVIGDGDITFNPVLPDSKTSALAHIGMDASLRVVLDFKQNFWGKTSRFLYGSTKTPEFFNTGVSRSEFGKTLSITINGPAAEEYSALEEEAVPLILQELDSVFNGMATQNIRRSDDDKIIFELMDWSKAPYIKGGISYIKPGGSNDDRKMLAEPVDDKIYFAGEATDIVGEAGTVNGALLSAERASKEVVESILNLS